AARGFREQAGELEGQSPSNRRSRMIFERGLGRSPNGTSTRAARGCREQAGQSPSNRRSKMIFERGLGRSPNGTSTRAARGCREQAGELEGQSPSNKREAR